MFVELINKLYNLRGLFEGFTEMNTGLIRGHCVGWQVKTEDLCCVGHYYHKRRHVQLVCWYKYDWHQKALRTGYRASVTGAWRGSGKGQAKFQP